MFVIGFGHRSRVGKDTSGKFLTSILKIKKPGIRIRNISFASTLKEVTYIMYKWAGVQPAIYYENNPKERNAVIPALGCTIVELWVKVGNLMRDVHPKTWINTSLFDDGKTDVAIITDVRYPNEIESIHEMNGRDYKISNSRAPILDTVADNALKDYTGWFDVILNEGSLDDLYKIMERISDEILVEL